ncbi:MAG: CdaR family protein [Spirochaetota bacterium]
MKLKLLRKLTYNWHIKLISIVLASILWLYVRSLHEKERFISVPIEIRNIPSGYVVTEMVPQFAKLVLRGKEETFSLIEDSDIIAYVDLGNSIKHTSKLAIKVDGESIPGNISIKEINPRMVDVHISKIITKKVRVLPVIVSKPPQGYIVEELIVEPEFVEIRGPASLLEKFEVVQTEWIDISNFSESIRINAKISKLDERIEFVGDTNIAVSVKIKKEAVEDISEPNDLTPD